MKALKQMFDFAFKRETIQIVKDLRELREAADDSWEDRRYFSSILIWIILIMMAAGVSVVAVVENILGFAIMCVRGTMLFILALFAEILSLGIRK